MVDRNEGMVKVFSPTDWRNDLGGEDRQIKIASTGLGLADKQAARKFASDELLDWISHIDTHPDCVYVHKVAMSGSRRYGPNRWGDGFREEVLAKDCQTFETHAKAFRHHRNSKDSPYYGKPKIARYRDDLGVVELVTEYYGTDKVASENGGRLADLEISSLTKTGHIPVSMGSHVPGDECVICHHWARKRGEHCLPKSEGGTCELFGCRYGMLKIAADGRQQYVDNPINCFFDISYVNHGADPIANGLLLPLGMYDGRDVSKLAAFYDKLAAYVPDEVREVNDGWSSEQRAALQLAGWMAELEMKLASVFERDEVDAGLAVLDTDIDISGYFGSSPVIRRSVAAGLAEAKEFPSFRTFAKAAGLSEGQIDQAERFVSQAFFHLRSKRLLPMIIGGDDFRGDILHYYKPVKLGFVPGDKLTKPNVVRKGLAVLANGGKIREVKTASSSEELPDVVVKYATLKLQWLRYADASPWDVHALVRKEFSKKL